MKSPTPARLSAAALALLASPSVALYFYLRSWSYYLDVMSSPVGQPKSGSRLIENVTFVPLPDWACWGAGSGVQGDELNDEGELCLGRIAAELVETDRYHGAVVVSSTEPAHVAGAEHLARVLGAQIETYAWLRPVRGYVSFFRGLIELRKRHVTRPLVLVVDPMIMAGVLRLPDYTPSAEGDHFATAVMPPARAS